MALNVAPKRTAGKPTLQNWFRKTMMRRHLNLVGMEPGSLALRSRRLSDCANTTRSKPTLLWSKQFGFWISTFTSAAREKAYPLSLKKGATGFFGLHFCHVLPVDKVVLHFSAPLPSAHVLQVLGRAPVVCKKAFLPRTGYTMPENGLRDSTSAAAKSKQTIRVEICTCEADAAAEISPLSQTQRAPLLPALTNPGRCVCVCLYHFSAVCKALYSGTT